MNTTERTIFEQFRYWRDIPALDVVAKRGERYVVVGCGTSFYLAQTIAAALNRNGFSAVAVPGREWTVRASSYSADPGVTVIAVSRSGESTETVAAARASRERGQRVVTIGCEADSTLVREADVALVATTHPDEGIVMTCSASLMLLMGLRFAHVDIDLNSLAARSEALLRQFAQGSSDWLRDRQHFVFLGGGLMHGIALEAVLKVMEMSCTVTQGFHPLEYRHGPISLAGPGLAAIMLYGDDGAAEAKLAAELQALGAAVLGIGGAGTVAIDLDGPEPERAVLALPMLQWLGELLARQKGLDTVQPRNLTKVVKLN
jgi:glucosamine--fructose-6-phosphate aminotransferase (isomerizing)